MPAEDPVLPPIEPPANEPGWQQLAQEAEGWPADHQGLQALRENHLNRLLGENGLSHLVVDKETKAGARFLHKNGNIDQQEIGHVVNYLQQNDAISHEQAHKAGDRVAAYLDFMADTKTANDGILSGDPDSVKRQIDAHVIKAQDVPESYFALQRRIAREQGHGEVEITADMRRQLIEAAQADQRGSLEKWVEYLGGDDGSYPDWFKRYTWDSVTRLGSYNKETAKFGRREDDTVAPYPELNREALAYVYDAINKFHVHGEQTMDDAKLKQLLKEGSFGRLYAHAVMEVTPDDPELRQSTEGSWTKYHQTNDPRTARRLSGSLQGHGTGWCTAGTSTAETQLQAGDFYVYYTRDEDNKDTVPRVAIRMQGGEVAEVRGVQPAQELEPVMADITSSRLQDLPGGSVYIKRAEAMQHLTTIDNLLTKEVEAVLSPEDVQFLYELEQPIEGFGYDADPRVAEIRSKRGERDYPELKVLAVERLRSSFESSYAGYQAVAAQLEQAPKTSEAELRQLFNAQLVDWERRGVLDYVAERIVSHGELHTPVITPNTLASYKQVTAIAKQFGKDQPEETYVYDKLYEQYSPLELSGALVASQPVRFSLLPSKMSEELGYAPVNEQRTKLAGLRQRLPHLNVRIPSVLDAMTFWQTLRARGDKLADSRAYERTFIRHFDLNPMPVGGWSRVPYSYVYGGGRPRLRNSDVERGLDARVAVG